MALPRSFFKYAQGAGNLIHLIAEHNQSITPNWSVGLNYHRNKIQNLFYDNLEQFDEERMTNGYSAQLFSRFHTRDLKYEALVDYTWNKYSVQETGGLSDLVRMDTLSGRQRLYSNSGLLSSSENLFKERIIRVNQFYRPGDRTVVFGDTTVRDTSYETIDMQWQHTFTYSAISRRFTDDAYNDELYPVRLVGSITNDSFHLSTFKNSISRIQVLGSGVMRIGADYELASVKQIDGHSGLYSVARVRGAYKSINSSIEVDFSPIGFYEGDWLASGELSVINDSNAMARVQLEALSIRRRPSFNEQFFLSNYLYWNQTMTSVFQNRIAIRVQAGSYFDLSVSVNSIENFVYIKEEGTPSQIPEAVLIPLVKLKSQNVFFKRFHLNAMMTYQRIPNSRIRLPELNGTASLFIQGFMFKKNMLAKLGCDVYYNSRFNGVWYDPSSTLFRNSNNSVGGFPMINAFVNMQVKTMQLFVVGEHLLQGSVDGDWQSLEGYPLRARAFRLGACWRLFN